MKIIINFSILDYGSPIYGLASRSNLALLDPVQNVSIHIATGAFRTSPSLSLCADAGIPPLHYRRLTLTAKLLTRLAQYPNLPLHDRLFNTLHLSLLNVQAKHQFRRLNLEKTLSFKLPQFSCQFSIQNITTTNLVIIWDLITQYSRKFCLQNVQSCTMRILKCEILVTL